MDRYVEMRVHLNRSGVGNGAGQSGGPRPDLEVEVTGGSGGHSAGTDPCMMEEQLI